MNIEAIRFVAKAPRQTPFSEGERLKLIWRTGAHGLLHRRLDQLLITDDENARKTA